MQKEAFNKDLVVHIILFLLIAVLLGSLVYVFNELAKLKGSGQSQVATQNIPQLSSFAPIVVATLPPLDSQGPSPTPVILPSPTPVVIRTTTTGTATSGTTNQKVTSYVPFSGSYTTTSTDWISVPGAQAYIDLKNNYSASAYVTFEASISAPNGGQISARLFDSTNGIAVNNSEVDSTSGTSSLVGSGQLNLWSGNNLYSVQIKSLNSFPVTFDSARIKIVY